LVERGGKEKWTTERTNRKNKQKEPTTAAERQK
jgi:hypothetical protein